MGFKADEVAKFIAFISIKSAVVQVVFTRWFFIKNLGLRKSIIVGFLLEMIALAWLGFATQKWCVNMQSSLFYSKKISFKIWSGQSMETNWQLIRIIKLYFFNHLG